MQSMTSNPTSIPWKRIIVALNQSPLDEAQLLGVAEEQGRALEAELILVHVLPSKAVASDGSISPAEARARTSLDVAAAALRAAGLRAAPLLRTGPVAATVVQTAHEHQAALVVVGGSDGARAGLFRLFPRGTAEAIARTTPCPALVVRLPLRAAAATEPTALAPPAPPALRSFADDAGRAGPAVAHEIGSRTVEVARIVGSRGRAADLRGDFRPLGAGPGVEARYDRVLTAMEGGAQLPAVELYKLGYGYYVVDGHCRVAAALQLGQLWVDAVVTKFVPRADAEALHVFAERRAFEQATGLTSVGAARPGSYPRLAALIHDYAARHALADLLEAAGRWYAREFQPVRVRLRSMLLHERFPGERTADVFVRVADHRRAASHRGGRDLGWEEALHSFAVAQRARTEAQRAA